MFYRIIILSICIAVSISNLLVMNSNFYQANLLDDAKNNKFTFNDKAFNSKQNIYPSLANNSVPILTYISRYDTNRQDYELAIAKLKLSLIQNPYSLYSIYLLARNYIFINDFNSAENSLEDLFKLSPLIESSSSLYFFILGENKNKIKLQSYRSKVLNIKNEQIWQFYLSALSKNIQNNNDKEFYEFMIDSFEKIF